MAKGFGREILDVADDFYEAYNRCGEGKNLRIDADGRQVEDVVNVPKLVNGLFACELYLKSMLPKKSWKKSDGHNLKALFLLLPKEKQTEMYEAISAKYYWEFLSLEESFDLISTGFQFWRYIHESVDCGKLGLNGTVCVLPAFLETFREFAKRGN